MITKLSTLAASLLWVFSATSLVLAAGPYYAATNSANPDSPPYDNWSNAGTNIIAVVNFANTNGSGTVWISNGVYVLTNQITITNGLVLRSWSGNKADVVLNGNYPNNPITNRCCLMSNAAAEVHDLTISNGAALAFGERDGGGGIKMFGGILSNCNVCNNRLFVYTNTFYGIGGGINMTDGTVTACRVYGNLLTNITSMANGQGAGIGAQNSVIINSVISNNVTSYENYGPGYIGGGGIVVYSSCSIISSIICTNYGCVWAGGIQWGDVLPSRIQDCLIYDNRTGGYGAGGVFMNSGIITNCVISNNYGDYGSLILYPSISTATTLVYNTTVVNNDNNWHKYLGAGVNLAWGGGQYSVGKIELVNCGINNNNGIGVSMYSGGITNAFLLNSVISGNKGPGVLLGSRGNIVRNCLITGNTNQNDYYTSGSGVLLIPGCGTAEVSCCTIVGNYGTTNGAGLRIESTNASQLRISSCIIYSNGLAGTQDVWDACAPANYGALQYSCIGSNPGFTGSGIITANPQFIAGASGNYRLSQNSPCVNRGTNQTWMTNSFDMDGRTRIRYGAVDMGAYEIIYDGTVYRFGF